MLQFVLDSVLNEIWRLQAQKELTFLALSHTWLGTGQQAAVRVYLHWTVALSTVHTYFQDQYSCFRAFGFKFSTQC